MCPEAILTKGSRRHPRIHRLRLARKLLPYKQLRNATPMLRRGKAQIHTSGSDRAKLTAPRTRYFRQRPKAKRMRIRPQTRATATPTSHRARPGQAPLQRQSVSSVASAQRRRPSALVVVAILLIVLGLGRAHELFAFTAAIPVGKLLLPIGMLLLVIQPDVRSRLAPLANRQGRFFWLFLFSMFLSVPFSIWKGGSATILKDFVISQVPYVIILVGAAHSDEEFEWLVSSIPFAVIIFGLVVVLGGGRYVEGRVYASSTYDPNDIALMAAVTIPFSLRLILRQGFGSRVLGIAGIGSALALVLRSGSRGGMLAVSAVVLAHLFMFRRSIPRRLKLALVGAIVVAVALAPGVFMERLASLGQVSGDYNVTASSGRIEIWKRGIGLFVNDPLTGVGLGQYRDAEAAVGQALVAPGEGFAGHTAHNSYLLAAAELGILGIIGYLGLLLPILPLARKARQCVRVDRTLLVIAGIGETLAIGIVGLLVGGFFLSATYGPVSLTLAAFGISFTTLANRRLDRLPATSKQPATRK